MGNLRAMIPSAEPQGGQNGKKYDQKDSKDSSCCQNHNTATGIRGWRWIDPNGGVICR